MVALSLVAQGTGVGQTFRVFALLVLPIGLLIGLGTYIRLVEADIEDVWLVTGMNRIRQAYIQLAPDLDPYFVTSHHDDEAGVLKTYSFRRQLGVMHLLSGSPVIVGIIDALLCGVVAAVATQALGGAVAYRWQSDSWLCSDPEWCSVLSVTEGLHSFGATCGRGSRAESQGVNVRKISAI